ncbi:3-beta hydroxysteroid dehydrogenase/isomerase [Macleaya cordata]|uniref:3-beta hydroxysteroid dehydrogenase/isomerase n=1 Tax=Macleaya cordata TaxID=56857 RepID=A0A200Q7I0_MACCD|nr:3-beta hydroxysteroid dehydrogenase/isomerase [Macleaya cordata]
MMSNNSSRSSKVVCITGGAGDPYKVGLLKNLPDADSRLQLFEADIYNPDEFDLAIKGCEFVFHVATPLQHNHQSSQYKNTTEAAIAGVRSIVESCIRSGTVKRLIYTATVVAASPLKEDGSGFKDVMDESCWTPLNLHFSYSNDQWMAYAESKTLAEKEILSFGNKDVNGGVMEVVTLACGLVGGDTIHSYLPESTAVLISQLPVPYNSARFQALKYLQALLGMIPILHIDDVVEAHHFCMDQPSLKGRYLCANGYVTTTEIADYYRQYYPQLEIEQESEEDEEVERTVTWGSTKLNDMGFVYKYDIKKILDDSIEYARKFGDLIK